MMARRHLVAQQSDANNYFHHSKNNIAENKKLHKNKNKQNVSIIHGTVCIQRRDKVHQLHSNSS